MQYKAPGLEWRNNSCYIDSTLFSMFYHDHHFDDWFLTPKHMQDPSNRFALEVAEKLKTIAKNLQTDVVCRSELVEGLRWNLKTVDSRIVQIMLDVEELLIILCKKGLNLTPFIRYTAGTTNYFHQIFFFSKGRQQDSASVQDLFDRSMDCQQLKFECVPAPALFLKMPRSNGVLQHCQSVLPNLVLDVSKHCDSQRGEKIRMDLRAVICLQNMHYTTYVRDIKTQEWCYFNDMGPTVKALPGFGKRIDNLASSGRGLRKVDWELQHMTSWAHMCIYLPQSIGGPNNVDADKGSMQTFPETLDNTDSPGRKTSVTGQGTPAGCVVVPKEIDTPISAFGKNVHDVEANDRRATADFNSKVAEVSDNSIHTLIGPMGNISPEENVNAADPLEDPTPKAQQEESDKNYSEEEVAETPSSEAKYDPNTPLQALGEENTNSLKLFSTGMQVSDENHHQELESEQSGSENNLGETSEEDTTLIESIKYAIEAVVIWILSFFVRIW